MRWLCRHFLHARQHARRRHEFLVIRKRIFLLDGFILYEPQAGAAIDIKTLEQPDLLVQANLLEAEARAFVDSHQKQSPGDGIDRFSFSLYPVVFVLLDPNLAFDFRENVGMWLRGVEILARGGFDDPGVGTVDDFV